VRCGAVVVGRPVSLLVPGDEDASFVVLNVASEDYLGTRSTRCSLSEAQCVLVGSPE